MNLKELHPLLQKINNPTSMGGIWHNENLDILFNGIDMRTKYTKEVINAINTTFNKIGFKDGWIINIIYKSWCKKLNSVMKSKTEKTYLKRLNSFLYKTLLASQYKYILYKDLINEFDKIIKSYDRK